MWLYLIPTALVVLVGFPIATWLTARGRPTLTPAEQETIRQRQRTLRYRVWLHGPSVGLALLVGLWIAFGWHHQWWWYALGLAVTAWYVRAQFSRRA